MLSQRNVCFAFASSSQTIKIMGQRHPVIEYCVNIYPIGNYPRILVFFLNKIKNNFKSSDAEKRFFFFFLLSFSMKSAFNESLPTLSLFFSEGVEKLCQSSLINFFLSKILFCCDGKHIHLALAISLYSFFAKGFMFSGYGALVAEVHGGCFPLVQLIFSFLASSILFLFAC